MERLGKAVARLANLGQVHGKAWRRLVEARASVGKVMGRLGNLGHGPAKFRGKGPPLVELLKFPGLHLRGMGEVSGVVS